MLQAVIRLVEKLFQRRHPLILVALLPTDLGQQLVAGVVGVQVDRGFRPFGGVVEPLFRSVPQGKRLAEQGMLCGRLLPSGESAANRPPPSSTATALA